MPRSGDPVSAMPDLKKDMLTAYGPVAGVPDPLTGAGTVTRAVLFTQRCSLQPVTRIPDAVLANLSGMQGIKKVWRCVLNWPAAGIDGVSEYAVNGTVYTLLKPVDMAGQRLMLELFLGATEGSA
jgi:hypothetical protein